MNELKSNKKTALNTCFISYPAFAFAEVVALAGDLADAVTLAVVVLDRHTLELVERSVVLLIALSAAGDHNSKKTLLEEKPPLPPLSTAVDEGAEAVFSLNRTTAKTPQKTLTSC